MDDNEHGLDDITHINFSIILKIPFLFLYQPSCLQFVNKLALGMHIKNSVSFSYHEWHRVFSPFHNYTWADVNNTISLFFTYNNTSQ